MKEKQMPELTVPGNLTGQVQKEFPPKTDFQGISETRTKKEERFQLLFELLSNSTILRAI